jgi:hypothetical protein
VPWLPVEQLFSDNCRLDTQSLLEVPDNTSDPFSGNRVTLTNFEIDRPDQFFCGVEGRGEGGYLSSACVNGRPDRF